MARKNTKKTGSVTSKQGSVTPTLSSSVVSLAPPVSSIASVDVNAMEMEEEPMATQAPISEEEEVSFSSRHTPSAQNPQQVGKSFKGLSGRQMHQRAGLVFPCLKLKKAMKKANAKKVMAGEKKKT